MNKVGICFEELTEEEMSQINGGAGPTVFLAWTPTSSMPCGVTAFAGASVVVLSYAVIRK